MKIAIIGAGVAGLSCAFELEKSGVTPVIFEKKSKVGLEPASSSIFLKLSIRHMGDPLKYLSKEYGLELEPLSALKSTAAISKNKVNVAKGKLGYIFTRGSEKGSLENQIANKVRTPIIFNAEINIDQIKNEFDHIVVATGNSYIAKKLNVWTDIFNARARIATVSGNFDITKALAYFNTEYCGKGFVFIVPNSSKEATISLIVVGNEKIPLDYYWEKFIRAEQIKYTIVQKSDIDIRNGLISSFKNDNIYLTGDAAGFIDDVIGVGSFNAIESGIFAARSIVHGYDYNQLVKPISDNIRKVHDIRKAVNKFENIDFDRSISLANAPVIKQIIYKLPFVKVPQASILARLFNIIKD